MIEGVEIKELITHSDERGFFREVIRVTDPFFKEGFGQWSHTITYTGAAKAWHIHQKQIDWWYVPIGAVKAVLVDLRESSPTKGERMELLLGEHHGAKVLKIPPGVAHGYRVIQGPVHLFYITSQTYDPKDEGRIPHDDPSIGYDWTAWPEIK
jgi:dTDP-4-dehydrorhamnose 3,5-epimerase